MNPNELVDKLFPLDPDKEADLDRWTQWVLELLRTPEDDE
jgi:hypothetical protein